jgi:hypothetical protein
MPSVKRKQLIEEVENDSSIITASMCAAAEPLRDILWKVNRCINDEAALLECGH